MSWLRRSSTMLLNSISCKWRTWWVLRLVKAPESVSQNSLLSCSFKVDSSTSWRSISTSQRLLILFLRRFTVDIHYSTLYCSWKTSRSSRNWSSIRWINRFNWIILYEWSQTISLRVVLLMVSKSSNSEI